MADLFLLSAGWVVLSMVLLWLLSLVLRDASIVDIWWGPGFAAITAVVFWHVAPEGPRPLLLLGLVTLFGLRLGGYLLWRNWGEHEDPRYQAMRRYWEGRFPWVSLFTVFGLQGVLMWLVSAQLQIGVFADDGSPLGLLDACGVLLFVVGFAFEGIGDVQLSRFRAKQENAGLVLSSGLWRYTRHPNYFGNALMHWGLFLIACAGAGTTALFTLFSPLLMTFLLLRISGVALLERSISKRRPDYEDYKRRTNAFFPGPQKQGQV